MIQADFTCPVCVIEGDPHSISSLSWSDKRIVEYIWTLYDHDETTVITTLYGPDIVMPGIVCGTRRDPQYRYLELTAKNVGGEVSTVRHQLIVAGWPLTTTWDTVIVEDATLDSPEILCTSPQLIKLTHPTGPQIHDHESDEFVARSGNSYLVRFEKSSNEIFVLKTERNATGLRIIANPTSDTSYVDFLTGETITVPSSPLSLGPATIKPKIVQLYSDTESSIIEESGYSVVSVVVDGEKEDTSLVSAISGTNITTVSLTDVFFSRFADNRSVIVNLEKIVPPTGTPVIRPDEFMVRGNLVVSFMPGSAYAKTTIIEGVTIVRAAGYARGSNRFMLTEGGAYFRTPPVQGVYHG